MDTARFVRTHDSIEKTILAKQFRQQMTPTEAHLWSFLRRNRLAGLHFRRQQNIHGFIVDFYCRAAALVIELDGSVHDAVQEYDLERTRILENYGLHILRFPNSRVESDLQALLQEIVVVARQRIASQKLENTSSLE